MESCPIRNRRGSHKDEAAPGKGTKMAKKTTKKAVKRKVVRKSRLSKASIPDGPYCGLTEIQARVNLHRKILEVSHSMPEVSTTGNYDSGREGEQFCFTRYADVRKEVDPILYAKGLTFVPYADKDHETQCWSERGSFFCRTYFALTDVDTGYQMIVPGCGIGMNRWWSLDSAMTLALKHALLQALMIRWDNTGPWEKMAEECLNAQSIGEVVTNVVRNELQQLKSFTWFNKETDHGRTPNKPQSDRRSGSAGNAQAQRGGKPR